MHLRRVISIAVKDLKAATRDGRILLALLMPIGLGLIYNLAMPEARKPAVTVAVADSGRSVLPEMLAKAVKPNVDLTLRQLESQAKVEEQINGKKADVGLVIPAGFDDAVRAGGSPQLTVVRPSSGASYGADYVTAALDAVLRSLAGQQPPATIVMAPVAPSGSDILSIIQQIGLRKYMVLGSLVMLVAMIAIYILPVLITEEYEKKTADALLMIASQGELVLGKALVGLAYITVAVPLLMLVTRTSVTGVPLFIATVGVLAFLLIGVGLLLGGLVRTVSQLNTWSSIPLLVLIIPAFIASIGLPSWLEKALGATPGALAVRLLTDSLSARAIYGDWLLSFAILGGYCVVCYVALLRMLSLREA